MEAHSKTKSENAQCSTSSVLITTSIEFASNSVIQNTYSAYIRHNYSTYLYMPTYSVTFITRVKFHAQITSIYFCK